MTLFPDGFDPDQDVVGLLNLVNINTPDGDFGFLLQEDGVFTDRSAKAWTGAQVLENPALEASINGTAPAGSLGMTFFVDPGDDGFVAEVKALGVDYVRGRALTFFVQPLFAPGDLWAPQVDPIQIAEFRMQSIVIAANGPLQRTMRLTFEGAFAGRNQARGYYYNTVDHAKLIGAANPSLTYLPLHARQPEKLF